MSEKEHSDQPVPLAWLGCSAHSDIHYAKALLPLGLLMMSTVSLASQG